MTWVSISIGDGSAVGQPKWVGAYSDSYHSEKVQNMEQRYRQVLGTLGMEAEEGVQRRCL